MRGCLVASDGGRDVTLAADLMRLIGEADERDLLLRIERRGRDCWVVWAVDSGFSGVVPESKGRTAQAACARALEALAGGARPDHRPGGDGHESDTSLRTARLRAGLTIEQLAVAARVGSATIYRAEHRIHVPRARSRRRLADALGLAEDVIFPLNGGRPVATPDGPKIARTGATDAA